MLPYTPAHIPAAPLYFGMLRSRKRRLKAKDYASKDKYDKDKLEIYVF